MSDQPLANTGPGHGLPIGDCHILVVDDTEFNRTLIGALLTEAGFTNIAYAKDGLEALQKIAEEKPDLLILDIMMPGMDGFEVCRRLRADHNYADLPVLVQTALSGTEDRNKAFAVGTTDLVSKPIDRAELLARVRIHLENRVLIRDLQTYRARLEGELAIARSMYDHLLPSPALLAGLHEGCALTLLPHTLLSSELGGDIWGVHDLGGGRVGVYLFDMAGLGISAALNAFRLHTLIQELLALADDPVTFLGEFNDRARELLALGDQATMIYGVVDGPARRFTYAAAAASRPLVVRPGSDAVAAGEADELPIGVAAGARFTARELPFEPGSVLVLYSRAVADTVASGSDAGDAAPSLETLITSALTGAATDEAFQAVAGTLTRLAGDPPGNDQTMVWMSHAAG